MSSRGKIRVTKSVKSPDKLIDSRGVVLNQVNFADSFIFSEVGNESIIEYDINDQNWYFDFSKMIPIAPTTDMFNILDIKDGDVIIYDPTTEKFINSQLLSNDINKIKSELQSLDYIIKLSNSRIQTIMDSKDTLSYNVDRINDRIDNIQNDIESITDLSTHVSSIDVEIRDIKNTLQNLPEDGYNHTEIENQIQSLNTNVSSIDVEIIDIKNTLRDLPVDEYNHTEIEDQIQSLTTQISQLTELVTIQQNFISTISSSGLSTFKYTEVDKEIPTGIINRINSTFELKNNPILGSEYVYLNGILQIVNSNYTITNNIITFIEPPINDMSIICSYRISTGNEITPNAKFYGIGYKDNASLFYTIVDREMPIGIINGENYVFELLHQPIESSESVFLNGVLQECGGPKANYNIVGKVITFTEPPLPGMTILCTYKIL